MSEVNASQLFNLGGEALTMTMQPWDSLNGHGQIKNDHNDHKDLIFTKWSYKFGIYQMVKLRMTKMTIKIWDLPPDLPNGHGQIGMTIMTIQPWNRPNGQKSWSFPPP